MLRYLTAGESHGKCLIAVIEGIPSGLKIKEEDINKELERRQKGFGRSQRMQIEHDKIEILSGIRWGKTTGSPICLKIENRDYLNWQKIMSIDEKDKDEKFLLTKPRPGHADLPGILKFRHTDIRDVQERASARETSIRVAVGAICKKFLLEFDIKIYSAVEEIGGVSLKLTEEEIINNYSAIENSCVRTPDKNVEEKMVEIIKRCSEKGDTVGGIFKIVVTGLPPGIGSYIQWDKKLDANIARGILSIQAVKGLEIGRGFELGHLFGSEVHDEIFYDEKNKKYYRKTNNAGGIEGGMTNGENLVIRAVMKPIPTLGQPLKSIDIKTKKQTEANVVRSDVCAVPSCSIIAESVVAYTISDAFLEKFAGDSMDETKKRFAEYLEYLENF